MACLPADNSTVFRLASVQTGRSAYRRTSAGKGATTNLWSRLGALWRRAPIHPLRGLIDMNEMARQRRELARLSDRELRDIGISRYEVEYLLRNTARPARG